MKYEKGTLMIDALLGLAIVLLLAMLTISFISTYYRYNRLLENDEEFQEDQSWFDFD